MKTIKIKDETHKELTKIMLSSLGATGERQTYDDIINILIKSWREKHA